MDKTEQNWPIRVGGKYAAKINPTSKSIVLRISSNYLRYGVTDQHDYPRYVASSSHSKFRSEHLPTDLSPQGKLIEALKAAEFKTVRIGNQSGLVCPVCDMFKSNAHEEGCLIGEALAAVEKVTVR